MLRHNLKIIWKERRVNAWALIELSVGFVVLWMCVDYLYFVGQRLTESPGRDYECVYAVQLGVKKEAFDICNSDDEALKQETLEQLWAIYGRIKNHPSIESLCMTQRAASMRHFQSDSGQSGVYSLLNVTPEYFDVFRMKLQKGRLLNEEDGVTNHVVICGDYNNIFARQNVMTVDKFCDVPALNDEVNEYQVAGVVNSIKRFPYERYVAAIFFPLNKNDFNLITRRSIYVRVKPEASADFAQTFPDEISGQINVDPFYFLGVKNMVDVDRGQQESWRQFDETKNIYAISGFLIVNVFLGVMGTFWLRVQSRRGNIGLRRAVGASKRSIKSMLLNEGLLILLAASLIGLIVCVHLVILDLVGSMGIPTSRDIYSIGEYDKMSTSQYFINYGITLLLLAVVMVASILYPAKKASDIPPVEALRSE